MKIAIIIERFDKRLGGAETSVGELAEELRKRGIEATLLVAKSNTKDSHVIELCSDIAGKRVSLRHFEAALKLHLSQNHYDIIHSVLPFDFADVYQPRGGAYPEAAIRNAESYQSRIAVILKKITSFLNFRRSELLNAESKLCQPKNKTTVLCLSEYVAKQFAKHYNLSSDRIRIIVNGVNTDKSATDCVGKISIDLANKGWLNAPDRNTLFLFAGHNFRLKGLDCLMKAMNVAIANRPRTAPKLIIAGSGNQQKYLKLANKLGITDNVFFAGPVSNIKAVLPICDVAVLPTFYDPCSRFILEALATPIPAITTMFNGASDLFENNTHGKIIDRPENIIALAAAISDYCEPANRQSAVKAIVADSICRKVSIQRHADELVEFYTGLTKS